MLLALTEGAPMKAYDLIAELDRLFGPAYRASPGGVYPALNALVAERLLLTDRDDRGKRYRLSKAGLDAVEKRRRELRALEERTGVRLGDESSLRPELDRFAERVMRVSGRVDHDAVARLLEHAAEQIEQLTGDPAERKRS